MGKLHTPLFLTLVNLQHSYSQPKPSVHAITARLNPLKHLTGPNSGPGNRNSTSSTTTTTAGGAPGGGGSGTPSQQQLDRRPDPPAGLEVLETENFRMQCFATLTGTKFLLFTDTTQANVDLTMRRVYDMYADYVMKNPFYQLEMPIRCDMFDRKLGSYIREINNR